MNTHQNFNAINDEDLKVELRDLFPIKPLAQYASCDTLYTAPVELTLSYFYLYLDNIDIDSEESTSRHVLCCLEDISGFSNLSLLPEVPIAKFPLLEKLLPEELVTLIKLKVYNNNDFIGLYGY
jgi:hypothetical protein